VTRPDPCRVLARWASQAPSAEGWFFDNPQKREIRDFATSSATSNEGDVAVTAVRENNTDRTVREERRDVRRSPPTPTETIQDQAGAEQFSTLSQCVVQTEQPTEDPMPQGHTDIPKHPDIKASRRIR